MTAQTKELTELAQKVTTEITLKIGVTEKARNRAKSIDIEEEL